MDFSAHPNPVQITGLPATMTEIAAGNTFCLAVASDGTVWSWGNNGSFQLGQGPQINQNPVPKQIPNLANVVSVAGGFHHSAALKTDGSVWTWGSNHEGALGDTSLENRLAPVRVTGLETVSAPLISPPGGLFNLSVDVTITSATPGATIHYSTNGNDPTESDPVIASGATLRLTSNTTLRARAWKPGLVPSSITGTFYEVIPAPPRLLLEENGPVANQLVAMDATLFLRDPFPVINSENWLRKPSDPNTRVILFALNVQLLTFESPSAVHITLTDSTNFTHFLLAEDVRSIPGTDFTQVMFRLPNSLAPGTCQVQLFYKQNSNVGTIRIKP